MLFSPEIFCAFRYDPDNCLVAIFFYYFSRDFLKSLFRTLFRKVLRRVLRKYLRKTVPGNFPDFKIFLPEKSIFQWKFRRGTHRKAGRKFFPHIFTRICQILGVDPFILLRLFFAGPTGLRHSRG